jgi:hypothetical protein
MGQTAILDAVAMRQVRMLNSVAEHNLSTHYNAEASLTSDYLEIMKIAFTRLYHVIQTASS